MSCHSPILSSHPGITAATALVLTSAALLFVLQGNAAVMRRANDGALLGALFLCGIFCWSSSLAMAPDGGPGTHPFLQECSSWIGSRIAGLQLGEGRTALLTALLTGDRTGLSPDMTTTFRQSGAAHLLALSGMHLGILYLLLSRLLSLTGNSRAASGTRHVLIPFLCLSYTLITGASPSTVRAFIFILLRETAAATGRRRSNLDLLCFTLTLHCALSPQDITSLSFQFSYLAVCGIFLLYPKMKRWFRSGWAPADRIWDSACLSVSCQVFTGPLAWWKFGVFPAYFLLTNLIAIPLMGVLLPSTVLCLILDLTGHCPGVLLKMTGWTADLLTGSLETICQLP